MDSFSLFYVRFIEFFHHMSLSRRAMNKFQWFQYSNACIPYFLFKNSYLFLNWRGKENVKTFDAALLVLCANSTVLVIGFETFVLVSNMPGILRNAFCLDIVKVLNKFAVVLLI